MDMTRLSGWRSGQDLGGRQLRARRQAARRRLVDDRRRLCGDLARFGVCKLQLARAPIVRDSAAPRVRIAPTVPCEISAAAAISRW